MSLMLATLSACGGDPCSIQRAEVDEGCAVYDGPQLRFGLGEPEPDVSAFCEAACVDASMIAVTGYTDLRKVPFLKKVRRVDTLDIDFDALHDLRGLERVDVISSLSLTGWLQDDSPRSLTGLVDQSMVSFAIDRVRGLESLDAAPHTVDSLAIDKTNLAAIDLTAFTFKSLGVSGNTSLQTLSLPASPLRSLFIQANVELQQLTWSPGLSISQQLVIYNNQQLSSCLVNDFIVQSAGVPTRKVIAANNGPCP